MADDAPQPSAADPAQPDAAPQDAPREQPLPAPIAPGLSALFGFAVAAVSCVALGWLGYQLVTRLGPQSGGPLPEEALTPVPGAGSVSAEGTLQPGGGKRAQEGPAAAGSWSAPDRPALRVSLQCLAGGRSEQSSPADPSNYGTRQAGDWQGRPVPHTPALIVLHETVVGESSALELFRRSHADDGQQASYHVLIGRDGRRIRVVDDGQRAFGAGDSAFQGLSVQLRPGLRPSVNNIALHVSLVSPPDGADGEARGHSGYTREQYRSLASQIALWQARHGLPASRVVTHQEVDRSGSRRDPRSFDWRVLGRDLRQQWQDCGGSSQLADLGRAALPSAGAP
jgi:N-acetyl-anhydromuramyl-L-alanine amidase AmpD